MRNKGFTLVELAIVLVIVGLLVGGVLQGQELIKQAQIRNVLSTINQYDAAVNTFRSKYDNGLPGDFDKAVEFGIDTNFNDANNGTHNGDGDGQLESAANPPVAATTFDGEIANFFIALGNTGLVKGSFTAVAGTITVDAEIPSLPVGVGMVAVSYNGALYYITGINNDFTAADLDDDSAAAGTPMIGLTLSPEEAYAMDSKLDDGAAGTGIVQAIDAYGGVGTAFTPGLAACQASNVYVYATTTGTCTIYIRASS